MYFFSALLCGAVLLMSLPAIGQAGQAPHPSSSATAPTPDAVGPAFEVATVKPSGKDGPGADGWMGTRLFPSGRLSVRSMPLEALVYSGYISRPTRGKVEGGPSWVRSDPYDIEAKVEDSQMTGWDKLSDEERRARVQPMLRTLLAERFHLKLHTEMRDTPVYALVQAKRGSKLKQVAKPEELEGEGDTPEKRMKFMRDHPGQAAPGSIMCDASGCRGHAISIDMAIGQIGGSAKADRIVINDTGLTGLFDFSYNISRDADAATPLQQLEDQLGLRFESRKVPIKTYVIDSAERPQAE